MRGLFLTVIFTLNSLSLFGQKDWSIDSSFEKLKLDEYLSYYVDEDGGLSHSEVSEITFESQFTPSKGEALRFGITTANIWLKLPVSNSSNLDKVFIILFEDPSLYRIEQYVLWPNGSIEESVTGISISPENKPVPGNQNSFPMLIGAGARADIYYKINSKNFISLPITANSYTVYHKESIQQRTAQGIYYGGLLIIIFYSFLAYFSTRNITFFYYFMSVIFFGLITGTYDGTTAEYFNFLVVFSGGYYDIFLSTFSNIFGVMFMLSFLEVARVAPRYYQMTRIVIGIMLSFLILALFSPGLALQLVSLSSVPFLIFVLIGGIIAAKKHVWKARYYLTAYGAMTVAVTIAIMSLFDVIPFTLFTKYILHSGFLVSLTILSIGLGHMINRIRLELNEKKVEEEIAKKTIVEQLNRELQQKVKDSAKDIYRKEANLRSIIDNNSNDAIWLIDKKYRLIDFNHFFSESFETVFGINLHRNENLLEALPQEIRPIWEERYDKSLSGEFGHYFEEYEIGGNHMSFEIDMYPIRENDMVSGVSVYSKNISEMKMAEEELRERNETLVKVNEELDRFVYSASHDLKAPLASVLGLINLTRQETDKASKVEYLEMMEKSIDKLNTFIDDIENYARNARTDISCEEISVKECIDGIIEGLLYLEGVDNTNIQVDVQEDIKLYSDNNRLNILLSNLINNALRYSIKYNGPEKTTIVIEAKVDKSKAVFSIKDNGPGISEEFHQKIFEMFFRVHESISGTGLGLYIVKESVDRLQGTVNVESSINNGARFIVEIPNSPSPNSTRKGGKSADLKRKHQAKK